MNYQSIYDNYHCWLVSEISSTFAVLLDEKKYHSSVEAYKRIELKYQILNMCLDKLDFITDVCQFERLNIPKISVGDNNG